VKSHAEDRGILRASMGVDLSKLRGIKVGEYVVRFAFGAAISLLAGLVTLIFGARVGGLFLAFPAILPATITLVEAKEGTGRADKNAGGAVLGAVALIVFAAIAYLLLPTNAAFALALALLGWSVAAVLLYLRGCSLEPSACSDDSSTR
jgi:Protein of unknown function (DUF3147)